MNRITTAVFATVLLIFQGCTTAGPFVTEISSDGQNHLHITRCMVHMNAFMGTVSNSDCSYEDITLSNK